MAKTENPAVQGGAPEGSGVQADLPELTPPAIKTQRVAPPPASAISKCKRQPGETADDYPHVVARLSDRWRVIRCDASLQWVIQSHDGERAGRARWTGVGYCQTRAALLRLCRTSCGLVDPSAWAMLDELPAHIGEMPQ